MAEAMKVCWWYTCALTAVAAWQALISPGLGTGDAGITGVQLARTPEVSAVHQLCAPTEQLAAAVTAGWRVQFCGMRHLACTPVCLPSCLQVEFTDADTDARQEFESVREEVRTHWQQQQSCAAGRLSV